MKKTKKLYKYYDKHWSHMGKDAIIRMRYKRQLYSSIKSWTNDKDFNMFLTTILIDVL